MILRAISSVVLGFTLLLSVDANAQMKTDRERAQEITDSLRKLKKSRTAPHRKTHTITTKSGSIRSGKTDTLYSNDRSMKVIQSDRGVYFGFGETSKLDTSS